ncbi:MAG TPA: hypothetical protein VK837_07055 [Longimicrobiales bacterium]|nr:hypothetical protein [Longimicrobiales bacterium]
MHPAPLTDQLIWLLVLSLAVATVAWTVTQEEVFREPRERAARRSERASSALERKFFYLFTCEYCFSHYVAAFFVLATGYRLLVGGVIGFVVAFFATVAAANALMSLFALLRQQLKHETLEAKKDEEELNEPS